MLLLLLLLGAAPGCCGAPALPILNGLLPPTLRAAPLLAARQVTLIIRLVEALLQDEGGRTPLHEVARRRCMQARRDGR